MMEKDRSFQRDLPSKPKAIADAEKWFQKTYSSETVSAVISVQSGKSGGLVYFPPCNAAKLEIILNLAKSLYDEASQ